MLTYAPFMYGLDFTKGTVVTIKAWLDKTIMKSLFAQLDMPFEWLKFLLFMKKHSWNSRRAWLDMSSWSMIGIHEEA